MNMLNGILYPNINNTSIINLRLSFIWFIMPVLMDTHLYKHSENKGSTFTLIVSHESWLYMDKFWCFVFMNKSDFEWHWSIKDENDTITFFPKSSVIWLCKIYLHWHLLNKSHTEPHVSISVANLMNILPSLSTPKPFVWFWWNLVW